MNHLPEYQKETRLVPALFFCAAAIGLVFAFNSPVSILLCASITLLPIALYILIFRREYLYPSLVFLIPLSVSMYIGGGTKVDVPSEPLLGLMLVGFLIFLLWKSPLKRSFLVHPVSLLLFLELSWMIFCAVNGELPVVSLKRCLVRCGFVMIFYLLVSRYLLKSIYGGTIFILYAAGCVVPIIHGFIFHARFNYSTVSAYLMPRPFFQEHTIYGACLAFVIPMLLLFVFNARVLSVPRWKLVLLILLTALIILGEIFSFSRAAWLSLGVALIFRGMIFLKIRLWMILLLLVLAGGVAYKNSDRIHDSVKRNESVSHKGGISDHLMSVTNVQSDASNLERINRWKCAIRMVKEKPVLGYGPGSYQFLYGSFQSRADLTRISTFRGTNGHAHSEFFNAVSETGIPGGIIYLLVMFSVVGCGLNVIYNAKNRMEKTIALGALLGLITFYVHGCFNAFLDTAKMAVLVFAGIAILVSIHIKQAKDRELKNLHRENSDFDGN